MASVKYNKTKITPEFTVAQVVLFVDIEGSESTLHCTSGTIWVDLEGRSDLSTANGFKMIANSVLDLKTMGSISIVSDVTTAKAQILEWGV
jgi:hypothetical protein